MENKRTTWTISDIVKALLLLFGFTFASTFLPLNRLLSRLNLTENTAAFLGMLIIYLATLLVVFIFGPKRKGNRISELGLVPFDLLKVLSSVLKLLLIIKLATAVYAALAEGFFSFTPAQDNFELVPKVFGRGTGGFILAFLMTVAIAPFVEEIFFRGFIYPALRDNIGVVWAAILSSFIFALFHGDAWLMLPIMMLGFALVYLYEKESSLWPSILLHSMYNLLTVLVIYFAEV